MKNFKKDFTNADLAKKKKMDFAKDKLKEEQKMRKENSN